jgi:tRNA1Val (adenine37-N6)-methyltransferase
MKVCTDACMLGAYADASNARRILDIGTGTGLLSLMLAQRSNATIEAVEIDDNAYAQALTNVEGSSFADKITLFHESIQAFSHRHQQAARTPYDLIISNPPFYQNSLKSPDSQTNKALHAATLTFDDLIDAVMNLLSTDGTFIVLLPPFEGDQLTGEAQKKGLYLWEKLQIKHNSQKAVFRHILSFSKRPVSDYIEDTLVIHAENSNAYSDKFRQLLSDYYTIF